MRYEFDSRPAQNVIVACEGSDLLKLSFVPVFFCVNYLCTNLMCFCMLFTSVF